MFFRDNFVIISGDNPLNGGAVHNASTDKLRSELERAEYLTLPVVGKYGETENSLIVFDLSPAAAQHFAQKYGQESYIIHQASGEAWLVYTETGKAHPAVGYKTFEKRPDDNFTYVPSAGKYFTIDFAWNTEVVPVYA